MGGREGFRKCWNFPDFQAVFNNFRGSDDFPDPDWWHPHFGCMIHQTEESLCCLEAAKNSQIEDASELRHSKKSGSGSHQKQLANFKLLLKSSGNVCKSIIREF